MRGTGVMLLLLSLMLASLQLRHSSGVSWLPPSGHRPAHDSSFPSYLMLTLSRGCAAHSMYRFCTEHGLYRSMSFILLMRMVNRPFPMAMELNYISCLMVYIIIRFSF